MTTPIKIVIPGAPVPKGRGRIGKLHDGRPVVFTPKKTQNYENLVKMAASDGMQDQPPFSEPVDVVVHVALPVPCVLVEKENGSGAGRGIDARIEAGPRQFHQGRARRVQ